MRPPPGGSRRSRIHALDVLRGLALAGMILVHFHQKMELPAEGLEDLVGWFIWIFVETKAWGVFALLFGAGFAVLLQNLESKGVRPVAIYLRRLFGLAVFGFVAEAFFGFHILLAYAFWGVPLLLVRNWRTPALLALAFASVVAVPLIPVVWPSGSTGPAAAAHIVEAREAAVRLQAAEQGRAYLPLLRARLESMTLRARWWPSYLPDTNLALFIIGLVAVRHEVFTRPRDHLRLIGAAAVFGVVGWTVHWLLYAVGPVPTSLAMGAWLTGFGLIQDQFLCLTYAASVVLLMEFRPRWRGRLALVGQAGRMALTNYLLQVAALDFMASGYGLGLRVRPLWDIAGTVLLFGALAVCSRAWLARFTYGPAEWVWRSFTYMKVAPNRRSGSGLVAEQSGI